MLGLGIYGNEKVDKNAKESLNLEEKESLNLEETVFKIPCVNFKPFINEYITDKWQTIWNGAKVDKLREGEPIIKRPRVIHKLSKREEIVLASRSSPNWPYKNNTFLLIKARRST